MNKRFIILFALKLNIFYSEFRVMDKMRNGAMSTRRIAYDFQGR